MLAATIGDSAVIIAPGVSDGGAVVMSKISSKMEVELEVVKCDCCGLSEECTLSYIEAIRQRYGGKWLCGLCAEAVKDEASRSNKVISADEAMARHLSFCSKFRSSGPPVDAAVDMIRALSQVLRKRIDSPKKTHTCGVPPCFCLVD